MSLTRAKAGNLTYKNDGTGAVVRTIKDKLGETVSVKDFGAVGDGVTDDTAAIQAALDSGTKVIFPKNTYVISSKITGMQTSEVDCNHSKFTGAGYFSFEGSYTNLGKVLTATVAVDDLTISIASSGLVEGDLIVLHDTADNSFSNHRAEYREGEFLEVLNSDATTVTLKSPTRATYSTIANVDVIKVTPITINFKNAEFDTTGSRMLEIAWNRNSTIENTTGSCTGVYGLYVDRSFNTRIHNCNVTQNAVAASGTDYGISIVNSQNTSVKDCTLFAIRHGFATGGTSAEGSVPVRNLVVSNLICHSTDSHSIDTHANSDDVIFTRCKAYNGFGIAGKNITISQCYSVRTDNTQPAYMYTEVVGGLMQILYSKAKLNSLSRFVGYNSTTTMGQVTEPMHYKIVNCDVDCNNFAGSLIVLGNYGDPTLVTEWGHDVKGLRLTNAGSIDRVVSNNTATVTGQPVQPVAASYLKLDDVNIDDSSGLTFWVYSDADGYTTGTVVTSPATTDSASLTVSAGGYVSSSPLSMSFPATLNLTPPVMTTFSGASVSGSTYLFTTITSTTTTASTIYLTTGHSTITMGGNRTATVQGMAYVKEYIMP